MTDRYLFRGFHPCENGTESVWIEGKEIKGKWVYGSLVVFDENYIFIMPKFDLASSMTCTQIFGLTSVLVIPETVGQYTGIEDKDGNKVFENDVVECKGITCFVLYHCFGFSLLPVYTTYADGHVDIIRITEYDKPSEYIRVIGNVVIGSIHSNPDILERKENEE